MSQRRGRVHVWTVEGRTLCDQYGREDVIGEACGQEPPCGPCVLAAEEYMARAKAMIWGLGQPDLAPVAAVRRLSKTRWAQMADLDALAAEVSPGGKYAYPSFDDSPPLKKENAR